MREILFRGKSKSINKGEWIYGSFVEDTDLNACCIRDKSLVYELVDRETVGQFTGLTDKNGNKIFEGDIVKFSHPAFNKSRIGVISYEMNETGFVLRNKKGYSWIAYANEFYEVIGNIYDNKELFHSPKRKHLKNIKS